MYIIQGAFLHGVLVMELGIALLAVKRNTRLEMEMEGVEEFV